ncbi:MAG: uroporphyrinogen-III synthase [Rhodospirillales bacterium]|nr:uroporphyrinogen-III synthase [Rhodospirillales bacterium]
MRLILTRPSEDSRALAAELESLGVESLIEPLLTVTFNEGSKPDLSGAQALLATSANGVRAFAHLSRRRDLPVYAVGDATARAAADAGFEIVASATGDVQALAALVRDRLNPAAGALIHIAGSKVAGDLAGMLADAGFQVRRAVLYDARPARALSAAAAAAMRDGTVDGVLFYSPRTAAAFVDLVRAASLETAIGALSAFCLSSAVGREAEALRWARVVIAERPDQAALLAAVASQAKV